MHSVGREAAVLAASAGLYLDPWQELVLDHALSVRPDGKWCHTDVGVMVSRQNGKGSILEALELWGLFINEETIMHTAHNHKTSLEHFRRMESLIRTAPELASEVLRFSHNNNDQVIELRSGARLLFGTRTKGAARGLTLDRVICDEAMYLTEEHITALGPTTMAVPNPQIWFTGSAGTKESTEFGRMRARAIDGTHPSLFYAEWSIDAHDSFCTFDCEAHDDPYSQDSFAKANPALGDRIAVDFVESRSRTMSIEAFQQEHLGVGDWPADGEEWQVIGEEAWKARADRTSEMSGQVVLAVATSQDRKYSCIAAAGRSADDLTQVEITSDEDDYDYRPGVQWVVDAVLEMWKTVKPAAVVIDKGQALSFHDELVKAGVKVISYNSFDYAQACGEFYSAVLPRKGEEPILVHLGQPPLNLAVAGADKKDSEDSWRWSKSNSSVDITPLVAATLAAWGYRKYINTKAAAPWVAFGSGRVIR
jgi:phage terminase large subunit-like protein